RAGSGTPRAVGGPCGRRAPPGRARRGAGPPRSRTPPSPPGPETVRGSARPARGSARCTPSGRGARRGGGAGRRGARGGRGGRGPSWSRSWSGLQKAARQAGQDVLEPPQRPDVAHAGGLVLDPQDLGGLGGAELLKVP